MFGFTSGAITRIALEDNISFFGYLFWYVLLFSFFYFVYFVFDKLWHLEPNGEKKMRRRRGGPKKIPQPNIKHVYKEPKSYSYLWALAIITAAMFFIWVVSSDVGHGRWECTETKTVYTQICTSENYYDEGPLACSMTEEVKCVTEAWVKHP